MVINNVFRMNVDALDRYKFLVKKRTVIRPWQGKQVSIDLYLCPIKRCLIVITQGYIHILLMWQVVHAVSGSEDVAGADENSTAKRE